MKIKTYSYRFANIGEINLNKSTTYTINTSGQYKLFITPKMNGNIINLNIIETFINDINLKETNKKEYRDINTAREQTIEIELSSNSVQIRLELIEYFYSEDWNFKYVVIGHPYEQPIRDNQYKKIPDKYINLYYVDN